MVISIQADKYLERQLRQECGGHRIQRVPPTERKGRVHTSTVTVAVLDDTIQETQINETDIEIQWFSGTGAGGQFKNKTMNTCRMTHTPTGISVVCGTRSRKSSYAGARQELEDRIRALTSTNHSLRVNTTRKSMVGSGMRGDKVKTYRFQDDIVTHHKTGKSASVRKVMKGYFELLW